MLGERPNVVVAFAKSKFANDFKTTPPHDLAGAFWTWWSYLNAPERLPSTGSHHLVPGSPGQHVSINRLRVPGKNGWLCIIFMLMLWRETIGKGETDEWERAVVDVEWVTGRLCEETFYNAATEDITQLKRYESSL